MIHRMDWIGRSEAGGVGYPILGQKRLFTKPIRCHPEDRSSCWNSELVNSQLLLPATSPGPNSGWAMALGSPRSFCFCRPRWQNELKENCPPGTGWNHIFCTPLTQDLKPASTTKLSAYALEVSRTDCSLHGEDGEPPVRWEQGIAKICQLDSVVGQDFWLLSRWYRARILLNPCFSVFWFSVLDLRFLRSGSPSTWTKLPSNWRTYPMVSSAPLCWTRAGTGFQTHFANKKYKTVHPMFTFRNGLTSLHLLIPWGLCRSVVPAWGHQLPCRWCRDGAWKQSGTKPLQKGSMRNGHHIRQKNTYDSLICFPRHQTNCNWWGKGLQPMMLGDTEMLGASRHFTKQRPNFGRRV